MPSDLPLSAVDFTCKLPAVTQTSSAPIPGATYAGGFVSFSAAAPVAGGTFQADSAGVIRARFEQFDWATVATPTLYGMPQGGTGAPSYDVPLRRWIPASAAQTSPNGAFYAYMWGIQHSQIHLVDVASGTEKVFVLELRGPVFRTEVADVDDTSVFLVVFSSDSSESGVWRLDLASGSLKLVAPAVGEMRVQDGYAWIGRTDLRDPSPPQSPFLQQTMFNSIVRVDLTSGAETIWYYRPGTEVWIGGLSPTGTPIVNVSGGLGFHSTGEIRLIPQPGEEGSLIYSGGLGFAAPHVDVTDLSPGVHPLDRFWFGNGQGLYLYTPSAGMRKVLDFPSNLNSNGGIFPAGDCR